MIERKGAFSCQKTSIAMHRFPVCLTLTTVKGRAAATRWKREKSTWDLELPRLFQMPQPVLNHDWITSLTRGRQGNSKQEQFRVRM